MFFKSKKKFTDSEVRVKLVNLLSVGCLLIAVKQKSPYLKSQNYLLVKTICEWIGTENFTDTSYTLTDHLARICESDPYSIIEANFGAGSELPKQLKELIVSLCMTFSFLIYNHQDGIMELIGHYCREIGLNISKAENLIQEAEGNTGVYHVMAYAKEFDESHSVLNEALSRATIKF